MYANLVIAVLEIEIQSCISSYWEDNVWVACVPAQSVIQMVLLMGNLKAPDHLLVDLLFKTEMEP